MKILRSNSRRITSKLSLGLLWIAISAATILAASECLVRTYEHVRYGAPVWGHYDEEASLWESDALGKRGRSHGRFKQITLNSLGFRGPELTAGTVRILCIGASETFGAQQSPGEEYPRQLERLLNEGDPQAKRFDILNLGQPGATLGSFAGRIAQLSATVHPSLAILYPSPGAYIEPSATDLRPTTQHSKPRFTSRLSPYLRELFTRYVPLHSRTHLYRLMIWWSTMGRQPRHIVASANIEYFRSDLDHLILTLRAAGIEPVVLTHATPFSQPLTSHDYDLFIHWRRFYPMLTEEGLADLETRLNEEIRSLATKRRVNLVDLDRSFRGCEQCFADFTHFNAYGASTLAQVLVPVVLESSKSIPAGSLREPRTTEF